METTPNLFLYPSASGRPVIECEAPVPKLANVVGELIRYACARSDSALSAVRALGLESPRELMRLARRHGIKLPWRVRR